jgi:ATP-dependent DNA helicase RecG
LHQNHGLTNEDIYTGKFEIRNRVVARVFKELNYIEQWGSGINRIKSLCIDHGLKEPFIEESGDFIGVRFFREEKDLNQIPTDSDRIINYIKNNSKITKKEVMELLNYKETKAKDYLNSLLEQEILERKGQGRITHYILKKN